MTMFWSQYYKTFFFVADAPGKLAIMFVPNDKFGIEKGKYLLDQLLMTDFNLVANIRPATILVTSSGASMTKKGL
jgi:hypothetical protein